MSTHPRRGQIRKLQPVRTAAFDEQFWPVSLALCLTAAIAAGAAVSLLRGAWMWGALIALPATLVATLVTLQRVRPGLVKRSLQLAVVLSAAIHLLCLIFFSLTEVFGKPRPSEEMVEKRPTPERVMLVTQRESNPVWRELNRRDTEDPVLEVEREPTRTEPLPPQPVELTQARPTPTPAASRRMETQPAPTKLERSPSQLRRSEGEAAPTAVAAAAEAGATARRAASQPSEAAASAASRQQAASRSTTAAPAADSAPPAPRALEAQAERREATAAQAALAAAPSSGRIRDRQTEIPQTSPQPTKMAAASAAPSAAQATPREAAAASSPGQRTETALRAEAATLSAMKEQPEIAQAERRQPEPTPPTISLEKARAELPRRSNQAAEQVASLRPVEAPSPTPAAATSSATAPQSASSSLTRAPAESALAATGANLQVSDLQAAGVAAVASDSVARRRSESSAEPPQLLNSQQASRERRTESQAPTPQSAWQVNTETLATRSGARTPAERTAEASAAMATAAASSAPRSRLNVEAGSSQVDLGPTKVTADSAAERVSGGGGAATLGALNPEPRQLQRAASAAAGTLASEVVGLTEAPRSAPQEARASGTPNATAAETAVARTSEKSGPLNTAGDPGELNLAEVGSAELETLTANRATGSAAAAGASAVSPAEAAEPQAGNRRAGISRAPLAQAEVRLGASELMAERTAPLATENTDVEGRSNPTGRASALAAAPGKTEPSAEAVASGEIGQLGGAQRREQEETESNLAGEPLVGQRSRRATAVAGPTIGPAAGAGTAANGPGRGPRGDQPAGLQEAELDNARRQSNTLAQLPVPAQIGNPGLGLQAAEALGSPSRMARRETASLALDSDSRFQRSTAGDLPQTATDAVLAKEAFEARGTPQTRGEPATELAIESGLEFLARNQRADGSWSLAGFDLGHPQRQGQFNSDMAATGLALLAFQGAGYTHREFKYAPQLQRAIDWMVQRQAEDGGLYLEADARSNQNCRMYSHAIAALALNEAFGMTQDSRLREPCQRALAYIVETQDEEGGWRYYAEPQLRQSDTSVTGWMLMALQSGKLAGLETSPATWQGIERWLGVARDSQRAGLYRYNPFAEDSGGVIRSAGRKPTVSMTAVGLLMQLYLGWESDDPRLLDGVDYLLSQQLPGDRTAIERDTYYWYYATQVLRHVGGRRWETWNEKLHPLLVRTQVKAGDLAGSWHPYEPVPDRWGPAAGRLYVTTMNLLSLEVNYRLLPLYDEYRTVRSVDR